MRRALRVGGGAPRRPVTERYVRRGLAATSKQGIHVGVFLEYDALYEAARDSLGAAETRFTEALALIEGPDLARVLAGLGTVLLRAGRFEEARVRFAQGLDHADAVEIETRSAFQTRVRLLDGLAEAERHAGTSAPRRPPARACSRRPRRTSAIPSRAATARGPQRARPLALAARRAGPGRARAHGGARGLVHDAERLRAGEAFVAWERRVALEYGAAPPSRQPRRLLRARVGALGERPAGPRGAHRVAAVARLAGRDRRVAVGGHVEVPLRSLIGRQVGERWHVSRVRPSGASAACSSSCSPRARFDDGQTAGDRGVHARRADCRGANCRGVHGAAAGSEPLVCLKRIRPDVLDKPELRAAFQQEMALARQLRHPNIVEVYDEGEDDGEFFVMERVDGWTLGALLDWVGALDPRDVAYLGASLCHAFVYLHHSEPETEGRAGLAPSRTATSAVEHLRPAQRRREARGLRAGEGAAAHRGGAAHALARSASLLRARAVAW